MELICAEILKEGVNVVSHQAPTLGRSLSPSFLNRKPIKFLMWLHCKGCYKCGALNALAVNIFWGETNLSPCLIRENLIATPIIVTQALWFTSFHVAPVVPNMGGGRLDIYVIDFMNRFTVLIKKSTNVAKHFASYHGGNKSTMQVQVIDKIRVPKRGRDAFHYYLQTRIPMGLNFERDVSHFYE